MNSSQFLKECHWILDSLLLLKAVALEFKQTIMYVDSATDNYTTSWLTVCRCTTPSIHAVCYTWAGTLPMTYKGHAAVANCRSQRCKEGHLSGWPVMKLPECCWLSVLDRCSMSRVKDTSGGLLVTGNAFGWSASWHWSLLLAAPWSRFMHLASLYQTDAEGFWVQQWYRRSNASEFNNDIEGQTFYWQFRMTVWIMVHIIYSIISDTEEDD